MEYNGGYNEYSPGGKYYKDPDEKSPKGHTETRINPETGRVEERFVRDDLLGMIKDEIFPPEWRPKR